MTFAKPQIPKELKVDYNLIKVNTYHDAIITKHVTITNKSVKKQRSVKLAESGANHVELPCTKSPKCTNCQGNHSSDSRDCMAWKREKKKEINAVKYTNNISFPEFHKLVDNLNKFPMKSYSETPKQNTEKHLSILPYHSRKTYQPLS